MQSLARLGFLLLGLHGVLEALRLLPGLIADVGTLDDSDSSSFSLLAALVTFMVSLGPPLLLALFSARLASSVFEADSTDSDPLDARAVLTAGMSVPGAFLALIALIALIALSQLFAASLLVVTSPSFVDEAIVRSQFVSRLGESALNLTFGAALCFLAPKLTRLASARSPAA